jgi:hypothetical protein
MITVALLVEQHVARLDVAMHEAALMGGVERLRDLTGDRHRPLGGQRCAVAHQGPQIEAVDVAHRDEQAAVELAGVIDRNHIGVIEARRQPRLAQEPLAEALVLREPRRQHLQGDRAVKPRIASEIHLAHAAPPDPRPDLIDAQQRPIECSWRIHRPVISCAASPTGRSAASRRAVGARCGAHR